MKQRKYVKGVPIDYFPPTEDDAGFMAFYSVSSRDPEVEYTTIVELSDNRIHCSCSGYIYRQTCKHVEQVKSYFTSQNEK